MRIYGMPGKKILYIDIGDDANSSKNITYLVTAGHQVDVLNLQEEARNYAKNGGDVVFPAGDLEKKKNYDEIILAAHGKQGDIHQCYSIIGETKVEKNVEPLFNSLQLAEFMKSLLSTLDVESFNQFILLICYAARTKNFEEYATNPLESFAYAFFYDFSNTSGFKEINMTAGIAEIRVGENGLLEVSTEEYLNYRQQSMELMKEITKLRKEINKSGDGEIQEKIEKLRNKINELDEGIITEALPDYGQVHYYADVPNHKCQIYTDIREKVSAYSNSFFSLKSNHQMLYEGDLVKQQPDKPYRDYCNIT